MAIIPRKTQKIFGTSAAVDDINEFGSIAAGSFNPTTDLDVIQSASFETGWRAAVVAGGTKRLPPLNDDNSVDYVTTTQLAYLFQEGIPEYDVGTEYRTNSVVKKSTTTELWKSLIDANTGNALVEGSNWTLLGDLADLGTLPTGFKQGLVPSNATDTDHDITIGIGKARSQDDTVDIVLSSPITKQIDAAWVAGDNVGGFPSGATLSPNSTYHLFVIASADGTLVDAGYDDNLSATNLLADATGYTAYKRVFSITTDGSSNISTIGAFIENSGGGIIFYYVDIIQDLLISTTAPTVKTNISISVPSGISILCIINVLGRGAFNNAAIVFNQSDNDQAPTFLINTIQQGTNGGNNNVEIFRETDNATLSYRFNNATILDFAINTMGFVDERID